VAHRGDDGRSFQLPELCAPGTVLIPKETFGSSSTPHADLLHRLVAGAAMILALLRIVNSPFGRVLQAVRENRFRAEALGYRTVFHLTWANVIAALVAAAAGVLNSLWLRYAGPDTSLSFAIMIDILLMVVIGGMGTMYGAIIGAAIFILAQNYLQALMGAASKATAGAASRSSPTCCTPTAGCSGWDCCSSPACISFPPASSASCAAASIRVACGKRRPRALPRFRLLQPGPSPFRPRSALCRPRAMCLISQRFQKNLGAVQPEPARPPITMPLKRMYCRSRPILISMRLMSCFMSHALT